MLDAVRLGRERVHTNHDVLRVLAAHWRADDPMLAGEQHLKPPELLALSNGENPFTARAVTRAMLTGPKAIRWATGAIPGLLFRYIDA